MKRRDYEYVVLGLGGLGSAAAYWLSRQAGKDVLGLEQFELGHVRGESEDHSRIIRLSYHTPAYVELAKRAYESWRMVAAEAQEELVLITGGLDLGPIQGAIPLEPYMESLGQCGVPYERLDAREIMRRWPAFRLTDDVHGIFQAEGGIAKASRGNAAHRRLAREHGALLLERSPVEHIEAKAGEVTVVTAGATYRCRRLVIAAGPWSNHALTFFDRKLPLQVTREQVIYFDSPHRDAFSPNRFPVWIWMDDPCFYGFPVFGEPAVKVAQDAGGLPTTAEARDFETDPDNLGRVTRFLERYLPTALGPSPLVKTCLYTLTPDRDFIIDTIPEAPEAVIAIGAGHAYKFASVIGRVLAELATQGATPSDLSPFRLDREILQMENPPVNYMV
jgi:sarcosine oxidase